MLLLLFAGVGTAVVVDNSPRGWTAEAVGGPRWLIPVQHDERFHVPVEYGPYRWNTPVRPVQ